MDRCPYASDYVTRSRPAVEEIAAFIVQGLDRVGYGRVAEMADHLREFWAHCAADTATAEVWAAHRARFTAGRDFQCSYVIERAHRALTDYFASERAAVAA